MPIAHLDSLATYTAEGFQRGESGQVPLGKVVL